MEINREFFEAIRPVLAKLRSRIAGDFVVFGSAPLYLYGVRPFNSLDDLHDLDVFVAGEIVDEEGARVVLFENDPDKKLYKFVIDGVEVDCGGLWAGHETWIQLILADPVEIGGYKFASLDTTLAWKRLMVEKFDRGKDRQAVSEIEDFLSAAARSSANQLPG